MCGIGDCSTPNSPRVPLGTIQNQQRHATYLRPPHGLPSESPRGVMLPLSARPQLA